MKASDEAAKECQNILVKNAIYRVKIEKKKKYIQDVVFINSKNILKTDGDSGNILCITV